MSPAFIGIHPNLIIGKIMNLIMRPSALLNGKTPPQQAEVIELKYAKRWQRGLPVRGLLLLNLRLHKI